jgi:hypothetical protein
MFPDGYASNISNRVSLSTGKVTGLKSHDYHIWIESLIRSFFEAISPTMSSDNLTTHMILIAIENTSDDSC